MGCLRPMSAILPDDDKLLFRFFSGALEADMGVRSTMGAQIESLRRGFVLFGGGYEMDDRAIDAAREARVVTEVLYRLPCETQRVLKLWYTPRLTKEMSGPLKVFGPYGRLVVHSWASPVEKLLRLCAVASRKDRATQEVAAASQRVLAMQLQAQRRVEWAKDEFSAKRKEWSACEAAIRRNRTA
jgi:hypothetical protein